MKEWPLGQIFKLKVSFFCPQGEFNHLIRKYHQSDTRTVCLLNKIVEVPVFGEGKRNNDFGLGFYCVNAFDLIMRKHSSTKIKYEGFENADKNTYYVLRKTRDDEANKMYMGILEEEADGLYIQDIMRGGIKNNDPRIPRSISE